MFIPYVGTVYKFVFISPFDTYNGVYTVLRIMTFDEVVSDGVDMVKLYTSVGKTEEDYNEAVKTGLRYDDFLKLENIITKEILHVPFSLAELEPDPNIKEYNRVALAVDLGIFDNISDISFAKNTIDSTIAKGLGVEASSHTFSIEKVWMTLEEYNKEVEKRAEKKSTLVNLYSEVLRLRKELDSQNQKIAYYEDLLIQLNVNNT